MIDDFTAALGVALKKLQTADRFESEIRSCLRGYDDETVERVIGHLKSRRMLDDARATERLVEKWSGRRAAGNHKLAAELTRRGAPPESIEEALGSAGSEAARAEQALSTKFPRGARLSPKERAKAARFLYSRGFGGEALESAMRCYFEENDQSE